MTWDPNTTQRMYTAIDKSSDHGLSIDLLRKELRAMSTELAKQSVALAALQASSKGDTAIMEVVKVRTNAAIVRRLRILFWTAFVGGGGSVCLWVVHLAWKGLHE